MGGSRPEVSDLAEILAIPACGTGKTDRYGRALACAVRLLGGDRAALFELDSVTGGLLARAALGFAVADLAALPLKPGEGIIGRAYRDGVPVVDAAPADDPFLARFPSPGPLAIPVRVGGDVVALLYVGRPSATPLSIEDRRHLDLLADRLATGELYERLDARSELQADRLRRAYEEARAALHELSAAQDQLVQSEKTRALGAIAGGIAHEFNNLLAIILGKTQLALERTESGDVRGDLAVIEETAWRAADTVRRLQAFALPRADGGMLAVDVNALIGDVVTATRALCKDEADARRAVASHVTSKDEADARIAATSPAIDQDEAAARVAATAHSIDKDGTADADSRGVEVDVVSDLAESAVVQGSLLELQEAITSLIRNALDAMPRGGRLSIATRSRDERVEISVADTGEGISDDIRTRIFDPFFTTRSPERAGLGLSVVHGIVGRHGGRVDVQSEPGRGATVTLVLPAARGEAVGRRRTVTASPPAAVSAGRILVIEDEEQLRQLLVDALHGAGHAADGAADGAQGLARFRERPYDVVITDLSMPESSGLEVTHVVKTINPGTPVIMITGWGHLLNIDRMRDNQVDLVLVKPFKMERMLSAVANALRLRASR
jgi:signal transduction histidine kinase/CheY-like chemotaxis protein